MSTTETTSGSETVDMMFTAGAHFGLPKARRHPSVKEYVYGLKQKIDIFNLEKTETLLEEAKAFAKKLGEEKKILLFIGGKPESHALVKNKCISIEAPFCVGRWIGGSITNFGEIKKRVNKLKKLLDDKESGALGKFTKLERLYIDRDIEKLQKMYEGLIPLGDRLPDAIFVIDPKRETIAVDEARVKNIPVIAVANSDCDITKVNYPIVANDATKKSIEFFVDEIAAAYEEGRKNAPIQSKPQADLKNKGTNK